METGKKLHLPSVVVFHPKTGLIIPVTGRQKMGVFMDVTTLGRNEVTAIANPEQCASVQET